MGAMATDKDGNPGFTFWNEATGAGNEVRWNDEEHQLEKRSSKTSSWQVLLGFVAYDV